MEINADIIKQKYKPKKISFVINRIKENKNGVILYLDNNEKINVSIEKYFELNIKSLKGLDNKMYTFLKDDERIFTSYLSCLRKLSIKDYSVKQITDFLKLKKGLNIKEINEIVSKLSNYGLLDDEKYCENHFVYLSKQLLSNKQIRQKLIKNGIDNELIDKYVINNNEDEYNKICKLADKYSSSIKNKSLIATKQTILSKLVNLGFDYNDCKDVVDKLRLNSNNEFDLLKKEYVKCKNKYMKKYEGYELKKYICSYLLNKGFKLEDINSIMEV